jgi:hypothetical protein
MALDRYEGPAEVQFNQSTLAQATSIQKEIQGNNNPVVTMRLGLAGRSFGAKVTNITVENAIPKGGLEAEFIEQCIEDADVTIAHEFAGKQYAYDGYIDSVSVSQSVDSPASLTFSCVCRPPRIL